MRGITPTQLRLAGLNVLVMVVRGLGQDHRADRSVAAANRWPGALSISLT
jgi:hypothetical protein